MPFTTSTTALFPFRAAPAVTSLHTTLLSSAPLSSSARQNNASAVEQHQSHGATGLARRERKEVPLPSQEGTKGLVQYALYVHPTHPASLSFSTPH